MLDQLEWTEVTGEQKEKIIDTINTLYEDKRFDLQSVKAKTAELTFYNDVLLLELSAGSESSKHGPFWYLYNEKLQVYLDGSSAPIHDMNENVQIAVSAENVTDYVRFFGFFVHGDKGPFFIVENADFPAFDRKKIDFLILKKIKDSCKKLELSEVSDNGFMTVSGTVLYGNGLFNAKFAVTLNGMIEMIDDDPIMDDIAVIKIKPNY